MTEAIEITTFKLIRGHTCSDCVAANVDFGCEMNSTGSRKVAEEAMTFFVKTS